MDFTVVVPDVEEANVSDPRNLVLHNASVKARAVPGERVLGADTVVALGKEIDGRQDYELFGKPESAGRAREMLESLSGVVHEVWSGIALIEDGSERTAAGMTRVEFRALDEATIDWYLAVGEWRDRAGAYAIQGRGAALVERIDGDYSTVVGLPVPELIRLAPDLVRGA